MAKRKSTASPTASTPNTQTAQARYEQLVAEREPFLRRARDCAEVTIPALMPMAGASGMTDLYTPFQSIGSRGLNHLSAKLLLALFPPGSKFFRLDLDPFVLNELAAKAEEQGIGIDDARAEFDQALSQVERAVVTRMEQKAARASLAETLKHLIVAGNVCLQVLDKGAFRMHRLDHYVVKRDPAGNPIEIIVMESVSKRTLPAEIQEFITAHQKDTQQTGEKEDDSVDLYTRVTREHKSWKVHQEVSGEMIPGTDGTYPLEKSPWLPLRWTKVDGEDYGRGHVEEYLGDLKSLEACARAIVEYAGIAAKTLFFVNEAGLTSKQEVAEAPNGAVLDGMAQDVSVLRVEKLADFQVVSMTAQEISGRLSQAFLLFSSIQRDAERVTAEEIRILANELEQALGGVYSILAQELQRPLVARLIHQMQREGTLPNLPDDSVSPQIVAGLEGLGRNQDLIKLDILIQGLAETFGPNVVAEYLNVGSYMQRRAAALGVDLNGLLRSDEDVQQARAQAAQQQMAEKLGPAGIQAAAGVAKAGMSQPAQ